MALNSLKNYHDEGFQNSINDSTLLILLGISGKTSFTRVEIYEKYKKLFKTYVNSNIVNTFEIVNT